MTLYLEGFASSTELRAPAEVRARASNPATISLVAALAEHDYHSVNPAFGKDSSPSQLTNRRHRNENRLEIPRKTEAECVLRVLDANANRAAEGLRTLEDFARLVREDPVSAHLLKNLRHQLASAVGLLSRVERLTARSVETDAGSQISTQSEVERLGLSEIVPAACERVTQSLRCLEEYGKLLTPEISASFKQLRYCAYDVLAEAELRLLRNSLRDSARLYLLVDCSQELDDFIQSIATLADAGVDLFQLRDKRAEGATLLRYARGALNAMQGKQSELIINDRVDIALACGAAGVHVGQDDLPLAEVRRMARGRLWIGVSTHNIDQAVAAEQGGADYIGCGPTFASTTKSFDAFSGTSFLELAAKRVTIPQFAIGGITLENLEKVQQAGFTRIAVSGVINRSVNPAEVARALRSQLSTT